MINMISSGAVVIPGTENTAYSTGTISNGHAQVGGVYVTVQKGTSADIDVDFTVKTLAIDAFNSWWSQAQSFFSDEQRHTLQEGWGGSGLLGGFLGAGFGLLFGGGDAYHYRNQSDSHWQVTNSAQEGFTKSVYNLAETNFHVTGKLTATGISFIPVSVTVYVQISKITFSDGKSLTVINTDNPVAATSSGDQAGVTSSPTKLNVVKL